MSVSQYRGDADRRTKEIADLQTRAAQERARATDERGRASLAASGEVLVSSTVKELVAGSGFVFEDRGEHDLKGVPGTWRLYAIASA